MIIRTPKRKMILLHSASDNAVIILDSERVLYVSPSLTSVGFTKVRLDILDDIAYLNVRETPKEIAHLANWEIRNNLRGGCPTS